MCGIEDLIKSTGVIAIDMLPTLHLHYTDLFFSKYLDSKLSSDSLQ